MTSKFSFHETGLRISIWGLRLEAFGVFGVAALVLIALLYLLK